MLERSRHEIAAKRGGGVLSYEVHGYREDGRTIVTRFSFAYINQDLCALDNGRVLGFDNAHGTVHRHSYGTVAPVGIGDSYEATLERFERELNEILPRRRGG